MAETEGSGLCDEPVKLNGYTLEVQSRMKDILNLKTVIKMNLPGTLERFEGKAKHVTDNRSWE